MSDETPQAGLNLAVMVEPFDARGLYSVLKKHPTVGGEAGIETASEQAIIDALRHGSEQNEPMMANLAGIFEDALVMGFKFQWKGFGWKKYGFTNSTAVFRHNITDPDLIKRINELSNIEELLVTV